MEQKQESIHITLTHLQQHEYEVIWRINPVKCLSAYWCVCVCVYSFKGACGCKHSALYVVTVNGRMHRNENSWPKQRILDVLRRKPKPKMLCNNYFIKYYKVIFLRLLI